MLGSRATAGDARRPAAAVAAAAACLILGLAAARPAAAGGNALYDNWSGQPQWTPDAKFRPPPINQHSESSTIFYNGEWLMYHRWGDGIGVSSSTDGNAWKFDRVAIPAGATWFGKYKVYAPKVLILPGLLTMVYEALAVSPDTAGCTKSPRQVVGIANSVDGRHWTNLRVAVRPMYRWEGKYDGLYCGNVGTPTINMGPDGYTITYHGFNGLDGNPFHLRRGAAVSSVNLPSQITEANLVRKSAEPMVFVTQDGKDATQLPQFSVGPGEADITQWQIGSGGAKDAAFYMVFEVLAGSPLCDSKVQTMIAIARSASPAGPWVVQNKVLLGQKRGCWRDMPAWTYLIKDRRYAVVMTDPATQSLQRILLLDRYH